MTFICSKNSWKHKNCEDQSIQILEKNPKFMINKKINVKI